MILSQSLGYLWFLHSERAIFSVLQNCADIQVESTIVPAVRTSEDGKMCKQSVRHESGIKYQRSIDRLFVENSVA